MPVRVVIREDAGRAALGESSSLVFDTTRVVIGRGEGCDVRLPDPSVSPRHATLRQHGGSYLLVDEGSTNGTFLGGVKIGAQAPRVIEDGARIRLGRVWLEVHFETSAQPSTPQATRELALSLVQRAIASETDDQLPRVIVKSGPDGGKSLRLVDPQKSYAVGRGHGVDLLLDEKDASRRHLELRCRGDQLMVRDLGSKNGTFLGDVRLEIGRDTLWKVGQELVLGDDIFVYENPVALALLEIERGADERLREGEVVPDPAETPQPPSLDPLGDHANLARQEGAAPIVAQPGSSSSAALAKANAKAAKSSGWGPSDLLIMVIAIAVFGLSVGGLWLLFHG